MDDIDWYAEAASAPDGLIYCAGSLAQCVRRWKRLNDAEKDVVIIELKQGASRHAAIAARPDHATRGSARTNASIAPVQNKTIVEELCSAKGVSDGLVAEIERFHR